MKEIEFKPIGIVHSAFKEPLGVPIQPAGAEDIYGTVHVFAEYSKGLKDIDGFSHIILIYYFHLSKKSSLIVTPFLDSNVHGIFATRAPNRPNPIGFSVVNLVRVDNNILHIKNVDIVDGTPVLDIKPCVPEFDFRDVKNIGWLENSAGKLNLAKDDGRFVK